MPRPSLRSVLSSPAGPALLVPLLCALPVLATALGRKSGGANESPRFFTDREGRVLSLPDENAMFGFAVFGDRTGGPPEGVQVLAQAVQETNLLHPDLVMTVGDLVQGYNTREPWLEQMREFRSIMDRLDCPWFPVAGNHDIYWRGADRPPQEHEADYSEHFAPLWYAFEHKHCGFVVLYSDEGDPATGERGIDKPECQRMSEAQLAFLDQALARTKDLEHVFVFLHHPRWLGGNYGDDWEKVHARLAAAGNVRVVFGGHIHRMRYDGVRDGIEYVTLATVGGVQDGFAPRAGYLHHYLWVTVREDRVDFASLPVGELMDVRKITGLVSDDARKLFRVTPATEAKLLLGADGRCSGSLRVTLSNPATEAANTRVQLVCDDPAWHFDARAVEQWIGPGEEKSFDLALARDAAAWTEPVSLPALEITAHYRGPDLEFDLVPRRVPIEFEVQFPADLPRGKDGVLDLPGGASAVRVADSALDLKDGPFTIEAWGNARSFGERTGFLNKTESSEFGLFVDGGTPKFLVHLGDRYVTVEARRALSLGEWHHLAGVFDGEELRLYVDGELAASGPGRGSRRRNALPLMIGADVDAEGRAVSGFDGQMDDVRISTGARYSGAFRPSRDLGADANTVLLLDMSGVGPWLLDRSGRGVVADRVGGATLR